MSKITLIDPNIRLMEYGNPVPVGSTTLPSMGCAITNYTRFSRFAIMNTNPMYDHMANILDSDAWPISNLHFSPSSIYCLVDINHEFILQCNNHASTKNNPQWCNLDHTVSKGAGFRVYWVV